MKIAEMDKLNIGDVVEVKTYNTTTEKYEWVKATVCNIYECTDGGKFAHGGKYSVYAKVNGLTECLDAELTRLPRKWICYYINSNGNQRQKIFDDLEKGFEFTRTLDKRIEKGTCGGYDFTEL